MNNKSSRWSSHIRLDKMKDIMIRKDIYYNTNTLYTMKTVGSYIFLYSDFNMKSTWNSNRYQHDLQRVLQHPCFIQLLHLVDACQTKSLKKVRRTWADSIYIFCYFFLSVHKHKIRFIIAVFHVKLKLQKF